MKATIEPRSFVDYRLERSKQFYTKYFGAALARVRQSIQGFKSVFLSSRAVHVSKSADKQALTVVLEPVLNGWTDSPCNLVGSVEQVDELTRRLKEDALRAWMAHDGPAMLL